MPTFAVSITTRTTTIRPCAARPRIATVPLTIQPQQHHYVKNLRQTAHAEALQTTHNDGLTYLPLLPTHPSSIISSLHSQIYPSVRQLSSTHHRAIHCTYTPQASSWLPTLPSWQQLPRAAGLFTTTTPNHSAAVLIGALQSSLQANMDPMSRC